MNYDRAKVFLDKKTIVHISKEGTFLNGVIVEVGSDFFFIDDKKTGRQLVFFRELNKPIEEFREEGEWKDWGFLNVIKNIWK